MFGRDKETHRQCDNSLRKNRGTQKEQKSSNIADDLSLEYGGERIFQKTQFRRLGKVGGMETNAHIGEESQISKVEKG